MTRQAIGEGAEFVLWPESSTPFSFEEDHVSADLVRTIARQAKVPILLGSNQIEPGVPTRHYNAAFLIREDGSTAGTYRKIHLVPFGEYVPLKQLLFFVAPLAETMSDFSAGCQRRPSAGPGTFSEHVDLLRNRLSEPCPCLCSRR